MDEVEGSNLYGFREAHIDFSASNRKEQKVWDDSLIFVKLHVTWDAMVYYAEYLKLRKPLRVVCYA